jgi:thiosulfate/3-mercaptopyruvate sulfurtransferase
VPIDGVLDDRGAFRGTPHLSRALLTADLSRPGGLITYCTIGARAATAWFVMTHLLGRHDVRVYDGSWAEWGLGAPKPVHR